MPDPVSNNSPCTRKPRVLVVENDPEVREANVTKLTYWNYEPIVASGRGKGLLTDARNKAREFHCQLALVDMHLLDDYDHNDWSGLQLVPELQPTGAIIYSGSRNFQAVREALSQYGALDFVGKSEDPEYLRSVLDRHAAERCACRHPSVFEWPETITPARVAEIFSREKAIPADEAEDLLVRLFPHSSRVVISFLGGANPTTVSTPRPRSLVLLAREDGGQPVIVKLARREKIEKELENYKKYVENQLVGNYRPMLRTGETLWDMGGAVFTFVGSSEKIIPFARYYPVAKGRTIKRILRQFFTSAWSEMYRQSTIREGQTLFEAYCSIWYGTWWLERLVHLRQNGQLPSIRELAPEGVAADLPEPIDWLLERAEAGQAGALGPFPVAVTHGDLHSENLLVDVSNLNAWVLDFERTGEGHILQDFVELEADLVTHLIHLGENDRDAFCSLCLFMAGQAQLGRMDVPGTDDPQLARAYEVIAFLRKTAAMTTGVSDARAYLWGILFNALFRALILLNSGSPTYRIHQALLLAAVLAHRLDHWDEAWPPESWLTAHGFLSRSEPAEDDEEEQEDHA
jgi:CheY-like chemotaxis protein